MRKTGTPTPKTQRQAAADRVQMPPTNPAARRLEHAAKGPSAVLRLRVAPTNAVVLPEETVAEPRETRYQARKKKIEAEDRTKPAKLVITNAEGVRLIPGPLLRLPRREVLTHINQDNIRDYDRFVKHTGPKATGTKSETATVYNTREELAGRGEIVKKTFLATFQTHCQKFDLYTLNKRTRDFFEYELDNRTSVQVGDKWTKRSPVRESTLNRAVFDKEENNFAAPVQTWILQTTRRFFGPPEPQGTVASNPADDGKTDLVSWGRPMMHDRPTVNMTTELKAGVFSAKGKFPKGFKNVNLIALPDDGDVKFVINQLFGREDVITRDQTTCLGTQAGMVTFGFYILLLFFKLKVDKATGRELQTNVDGGLIWDEVYYVDPEGNEHELEWLENLDGTRFLDPAYVPAWSAFTCLASDDGFELARILAAKMEEVVNTPMTFQQHQY